MLLQRGAAAMRRALGQNTIVDGWGTARREDTFTCRHCQHVEPVPPGSDPYEVGGYCSGCDALICKRCAAKRTCRHFERLLAAREASNSFRTALEEL